MRLALTTAVCVLAFASAANAAPQRPSSPAAPISAPARSARPAAAVVDAFHSALQRGDTKAALGFLANDALIFEAGGVERGKAEYASHHLAADAAFSQAVPARITRRAGEAVGNVAWIATEGRTTGTYKGKPVDRRTVETMVLRRTAAGWKIAHIHWSSAAGGK
ncbi:MAG TPA: nuclear transport factor 2 family protein [Sphingomicrobium sp.]|nr:nuclear transport factor 2 family protein [Sphingomicrobium sp.]